ncbi:MAG: glycosyltransferase family 4 protein [Firmicutes bacterium]|nr:glycosyltransferase family 4 protein [Bacillota bacterium]
MSKRFDYVLTGTYPPRECGIATFTRDTRSSIEMHRQGSTAVIAISDGSYSYPPEVFAEIPQQDAESYKKTAGMLNSMEIKKVLIQHEYGIFGGKEGEYLLEFLRELKKPVIASLHTILPLPSKEQKFILQELGKHSEFLVVLNSIAIKMLDLEYDMDISKIKLIHHGAPDVPFTDPNDVKPSLGLAGKKVISTFGLLNTDKGIEYMIHAMPDIVAEHPDAIYMILGASHPAAVKYYGGDFYREKLENIVKILNLTDHVKFVNRYLSQNELVNFLLATDVYVTPYLNPNQIVSGTLAYAAACGKAIVSTPYLYAEEILAHRRGFLVDFKDLEGLGRIIRKLLKNNDLRNEISLRTYQFGRSLIWENVGREYVKLLEARQP